MDVAVSDLCKSYGGLRVLDRFSAVFPEGEVTCIMGPSGRGKTTLLRILMGLERPDAGTISGLEGRRPSAVFQEDRLCENLSPVSNLRLVCGRLPRAGAAELLAGTGLLDCLERPVRELSGGMKRRVALARALAAEYDLLLLDEPFRGLDGDTRLRCVRFIRERAAGRTVILVTHDPQEPELMGGTVLKM